MDLDQWFIYIVRTNSGSLYTGISTDVERRFQEHQVGGLKGAKSLKGKGPLSLEFSAQVGDRSQASKLEARVKKLSKADKEALVARQIELPVIDGDLSES
jgi:putative endonuclease